MSDRWSDDSDSDIELSRADRKSQDLFSPRDRSFSQFSDLDDFESQKRLPNIGMELSSPPTLKLYHVR